MVGSFCRNADITTARPISATKTSPTTMLVIIKTVFRVRDIAM
jgi:hypothetical protein